MKHLKLFIASLFLMLGMAVHAQQVEITKTDGTVEVFKPNEVDSVVYKPAPKYYYYAGWECPETEEDLVRLAVEPNGAYIGTTLGTYTKSNPLRYYGGEVTNTTVTKYYIVIPNNLHLYDSEGDALVEDVFDIVKTTIPNHKIFKSQVNAKRIAGVMIR